MNIRLANLNLLIVTTMMGNAIYIPNLNAGVSLLGPIKKQERDGIYYQSTYVVCSKSKARLPLYKKEGSTSWCDSINGTSCSKDKIKISKKLCSRAPGLSIKKASKVIEIRENKGGSDRIQALLKEQRDIQDSLLKIKARRLEVRKRELSLLKKKRALELTN